MRGGAWCAFLFVGLLIVTKACNAQPPSAPKKAVTADEKTLIEQGLIPALPELPKEKDGFISWKRFSKFDKTLKELAGTSVKVQGFMFPLDQAEEQGHFLLTMYPPSCPFCLPAGPEGMIEVFATKPIPFSYDLIDVQGTIEFPEKDPMGLRYRLRSGVLAH